jgi:adenine-specific DNA-methyltransferase
MTKLPRIKGQEVVAALRRAGFEVIKEIKNWYVNPAMPDEAVRDFEELGKGENGLEKQKRLLAELLDKNQLYVNLSEIDDAQFGVSGEDKELHRKFYGEQP